MKKQWPIPKLCDELGLQPTVFYRWQKEFFENVANTGALLLPQRLKSAIHLIISYEAGGAVTGSSMDFKAKGGKKPSTLCLRAVCSSSIRRQKNFCYESF